MTNLVVVWRSVLEELGQILSSLSADMEFVKNFTPSDFQEKFLHRQFHLILTVLVRKNTKNE